MGLPVVGSSESRGCETIRLWTAVVDLDKYAQRLQAKWTELPEDTAAEVCESMAVVLYIVKDAERLQESADYKEMGEKMDSSEDLGTGRKICGYRVQLISVKLE